MERQNEEGEKNNDFLKRNIIFTHLIIGIAIFYFIIHPITMVIYWFEFSKSAFSINLLMDVIGERIYDSFSFKMVGMSSIFILIGGIVGLGSGVYYKKILQKNKTLKVQETLLGKNIQLIINKGENEKVEFKSSLRYDYSTNKINKVLEKVFLKTIAGFLNAKGGTLLIGVEDGGKIIGLENDYATLRKKNRDGFELRLMQLISSVLGTEYCALVRILFYNLEGKDICSIEISAASAPVYVNSDGKTIFYLRTGNSTKQLTVQEAVNYINLKKKI